MGQWTLPGPDALRLSKPEVQAVLGVSESTLDRMIADGRFPRGLKPSPQAAPFWSGADLAAWMHLAGRMQQAEDRGPEKTA